MSINLPAAIIEGKGGDSERVYLVRVIPEAGDAWSEYDWATKDITVTAWEGGADKVFLGRVLAEKPFTPIEQSIDLLEGGNIATIGGLTITLASPEFNDDKRFDEEIESYNFENRTVEIYLAMWKGSNPAYTDILLKYRGVIVDIKYSYGNYLLMVESAVLKRHKTIPGMVLTEINYPDMPKQNAGKVAPLLYGDVSFGATTYAGSYKAAPCIKVDKNKDKYVVAGNHIREQASPKAFLYHSEADRWQDLYYRDPAWLFSITYGRPTILHLVAEDQAGSDILGATKSQPDRQGTQTTPPNLDYSNAVDADGFSHVTLTAGQKLYLRVPMPANIGQILWEDEESEGNPRLYLYVSYANMTGEVKARYYNATFQGGIGRFSDGVTLVGALPLRYNFGEDKSAHGSQEDISDLNDRWRADEIASYEWGIEVISGSIEIREMHLTVLDTFIVAVFPTRASLPFPAYREWLMEWVRLGLKPFNELRSADKVHTDAVGADFGTWITENSRSSGWLPGETIEGAGYPVEAILRDELGLTSTEINYQSFDALGKKWDGSRVFELMTAVICSQQDSRKIIAEFCRNLRTLHFCNYEMKETMRALDNETAVKTIDRTTILEESIKVELSPLDCVYNELEIKFDQHWSNGAFRRAKFVNASTHNFVYDGGNSRAGGASPATYTGVCVDSQAKYNMTRKFVFEAAWASHLQVGENIAKWFCIWLAYRKYIVEFKTGLDHLELELGDQVKIDHTLLPAGVSNSSGFILFDISDDLNSDQMTLKFLQVPDGLPVV